MAKLKSFLANAFKLGLNLKIKRVCYWFKENFVVWKPFLYNNSNNLEIVLSLKKTL